MMRKLHGKIRAKWVVGMLIGFVMMALSACGGGNDRNRTDEEYLVLEQQTEECLLLGDDLQGKLLSSQYYEGEIIQFWSVVEDGGSLDIYLCRRDAEKKLLFENVAASFGGQWFLDNEGNYYILSREEIAKVDGNGNLFFRKNMKGSSLVDICQLPDGQIFLLEYTESVMKLRTVDPATGEIAAVNNVAIGDAFNQRITAGESGLLLLNAEGIWSIDTGNGTKTSVMSLAEYDYELGSSVSDFRYCGQDTAEILYSGEVETLKVTDIGSSRTIITVRFRNYVGHLKEYIPLFNKSNDTYYVAVETLKEGEEFTDFLAKTNLEIGTGKGADIVFYNAMNDPEGFLDKGVFEDLRPYMEASGMKEEDYFSAAFGSWKFGDSIYAVNVTARPSGVWISEELLGSQEAPDMETLLDALLGYEEKAIFQTTWESDQVLEYFLAGSESLWGMVDWEKGTCDFNSELFVKMLEAAKRYGFDRTEEHPYLAYPISPYFYSYETHAKMESEGKVPVGYIFEDGCYMIINQSGAMAINSNSDDAHKQGAWEFIKFLLSDEIQTSMGTSPYPVCREAFESVAKREMEEGSIVFEEKADGSTSRRCKAGDAAFKELNYDQEAYKALYDLTEEKVAEIRTMLETSRALPTSTVPLITIINEEASAYFNGSKSIEEVLPIIQNRVQLYLDEK